MERSKIPEKFLRWSNLWDGWHEKLGETGTSSLEACLAYPFSLEQVDQVIVGVDSAKQLKGILTAAEDIDHAMDTSFMSSTDANLINPFNWNRL